ncbi:hypothetical protein OIU84_020259, partial [Salix udensis]
MAILNKTLFLEEKFWQQKSGCKWLLEGDRNTRYYQLLLKKKRVKNFIWSIQNDDGSVLNDVVEIKRSDVEYFSALLTKDNAINVDTNDIDWSFIPNIITDEDNNFLLISLIEMRFVREDLVEVVVDFFNGGAIPKGRRIEDNILLAQELVQSIDEKTRGSNVILKLDMMKAYDETLLVGLRQGDPISPTLFIIAAEYLSRGLYNMFQRYPSLHYLARCPCSGQKVNSSNSGFILSARASLSRTSVVGGALGFPRIRLPIKYPGMSLYKGPKKSFLWDDLISKIAARMEGWEAKVLSSGGRITILKSILIDGFFICYMLLCLPNRLCAGLKDSLTNSCGAPRGKKRIHWECWEDLCYPVEEGGGASVHDSPIWKRLSKVGRACEDLIRWKVGCGKINFWHDIWVDDSALSSTRVDHPLWSLTAHGGFSMYIAWNMDSLEMSGEDFPPFPSGAFEEEELEG